MVLQPQIEVRCERCRAKFSTPVPFLSGRVVEVSDVFGFLAQCPRCHIVLTLGAGNVLRVD